MNNNDPTVRESRSKPANDHLMKLPKFSKVKASNSCFNNYAPEAWNSLPLGLRMIDNITRFKSQLKHFLFDQM